MHEDFGNGGDLSAAFKDLVVVLQNLGVFAVGEPGQVVGADEQEDGQGFRAQDIIQPLDHPEGVIGVDAAILERNTREKFLPAAAIGDAVSHENDIPPVHRETAEEIRALGIVILLDAFHSVAAEREEEQGHNKGDGQDGEWHGKYYTNQTRAFFERRPKQGNS